jgi:hypothetical protein
VVTTDLGPSTPRGVVLLGMVDTGLRDLVAAGNRFDMTFEAR